MSLWPSTTHLPSQHPVFSSARPLIPLIYFIYHSVCSWDVYMSQSGPRRVMRGPQLALMETETLFLLGITSEGCQHRAPEETQETETSRQEMKDILTHHGIWSRHNQATFTLDYSVIPANKVNPIWVGFSRTELWRTKTSSVFEQTLSTASKGKADANPYLSVSKRRLSSLLCIFFSCITRFCNFPQLCTKFSLPFYIVLVMFKLKIYSHSLLS